MFLFNGQLVKVIDKNGAEVSVNDVLSYILIDIHDEEFKCSCKAIGIVSDRLNAEIVSMRFQDMGEDGMEFSPVLVELVMKRIGENVYQLGDMEKV
jgi:carbamate kinase